MTLSFEKISLQHVDIIFDWLAEPFIQEFWDNTQGHKDDILNLLMAEKSLRIIVMGSIFIGCQLNLHEGIKS